jgi:hypothetical protein
MDRLRSSLPSNRDCSFRVYFLGSRRVWESPTTDLREKVQTSCRWVLTRRISNVPLPIHTEEYTQRRYSGESRLWSGMSTHLNDSSTRRSFDERSDLKICGKNGNCSFSSRTTRKHTHNNATSKNSIHSQSTTKYGTRSSSSLTVPSSSLTVPCSHIVRHGSTFVYGQIEGVLEAALGRLVGIDG